MSSGPIKGEEMTSGIPVPLNEPSRGDFEVRHFYGYAAGWNMFDSRFLSDELANYLREEGHFLSQVFNQSSYDHLVEVGCGYGRYLRWAQEHRVSYDGIDLVPWLVELGQLRIQTTVPLASERYQIQMVSAQQVHLVLHQAKDLSPRASIVHFPFNCFGNLAELHRVMVSLRQGHADVTLSVFKSDVPASSIRRTYYEKCGYTKVAVNNTPTGVLITSAEGLHTYAYELEFLVNIFAKYGFALQSERMAAISRFLHFKNLSAPTADSATQPTRRNGQRVPARLEGTLTVIQDPAHELTDLSALMSFQENGAVTRNVSRSGLLMECGSPLTVGALVQVKLTAMAGMKSEPIVGRVVRAEMAKDRHLIGIAIAESSAVQSAVWLEQLGFHL